MAHIIVENLDSKAIDCKNKKERLLDILLAETDWMHACGGKGRCTTCRAIVLEGHLAPIELTDPELRFFTAGRLLPNERLTCQTYMTDETVRIRVPQSSKLPHINYTD